VSVLTRKHPADDIAGMRDRVAATAQRAVPAAKNALPTPDQVVPLAKSAGEAIRQGAEDAAAWARPRVDDAAAWARPHVDDVRSWAAPRLERSGQAVTDTIAPAVSAAMVSAARKIDAKPARKRRRWAGITAGLLLLAAAASAAAAAALRRRPADFGYATDDADEMVAPATVTPAAGTATDLSAETPVVAPDPEANGHSNPA
jgi:hypothetical protein